jgi:histone acetyltransferase
MQWIVEKLKTYSRAWPFLNPVTKDIAAQYYEIITKPMDLAALEASAEVGKYGTLGPIVRAARLIFSNCMTYNSEGSVYVRSAQVLEAYFNEITGECMTEQTLP